MREQLLQQARDAVKAALDAGADDASASVSSGRALEFKWRDEKLEKVQEDTTRSLGIAFGKPRMPRSPTVVARNGREHAGNLPGARPP